MIFVFLQFIFVYVLNEPYAYHRQAYIHVLHRCAYITTAIYSKIILQHVTSELWRPSLFVSGICVPLFIKRLNRPGVDYYCFDLHYLSVDSFA